MIPPTVMLLVGGYAIGVGWGIGCAAFYFRVALKRAIKHWEYTRSTIPTPDAQENRILLYYPQR